MNSYLDLTNNKPRFIVTFSNLDCVLFCKVLLMYYYNSSIDILSPLPPPPLHIRNDHLQPLLFFFYSTMHFYSIAIRQTKNSGVLWVIFAKSSYTGTSSDGRDIDSLDAHDFQSDNYRFY